MKWKEEHHWLIWGLIIGFFRGTIFGFSLLKIIEIVVEGQL